MPFKPLTMNVLKAQLTAGMEENKSLISAFQQQAATTSYRDVSPHERDLARNTVFDESSLVEPTILTTSNKGA